MVGQCDDGKGELLLLLAQDCPFAALRKFVSFERRTCRIETPTRMRAADPNPTPWSAIHNAARAGARSVRQEQIQAALFMGATRRAQAGQDGLLTIASSIVPTLTTVKIDRIGVGRRVGRVLLQRLSGEPLPCKVTDVGFQIVQRCGT